MTDRDATDKDMMGALLIFVLEHAEDGKFMIDPRAMVGRNIQCRAEFRVMKHRESGEQKKVLVIEVTEVEKEEEPKLIVLPGEVN